jgi:hypothetical protein
MAGAGYPKGAPAAVVEYAKAFVARRQPAR